MPIYTESVVGRSYRNRAFENDYDGGAPWDQEAGHQGTIQHQDVFLAVEVNGKHQDLRNSKTEHCKEADGNNISEHQLQTKEAEESTKDNDEVPDGGWGWIVAIGGFLAQLMVNILVSGFGILYSEFLMDLGTSAVMSSWIFNLMGFMLTFVGMLNRGLVDEFGLRKTMLIGAFLIFVGTVASSFTNSAWNLLFFYSIVTGIGCGILGLLGYAVVPYYFKRRLGIANAIMASGISGGQSIGPIIITLLKDTFGFRGGILVLGAVILNTSVSAMVYHPVEWHRKCPIALPKNTRKSKGGLSAVLRVMKNTLNNLKLLKSPVAVSVAVSGTINYIGYVNFLTILPFAMQEEGFTADDAAYCAAISGTTNLVARLLVSIMSDYTWLNMRYAYMAGTVIAFVLSILFCFVKDLTTKMFILGLWGLGVGTYMGLFSLVMVLFVGRQKLLAELGLYCFMTSVWFLACGPILGVISDLSGSYTWSLLALSSTYLISLVLYICLPTAVAFEKRRQNRRCNDGNGANEGTSNSPHGSTTVFSSGSIDGRNPEK